MFAYVYNNDAVAAKEIGTIAIGAALSCSIKTTATEYVFTAGEHGVIMPRLSTTPKAKGYLLYPYFGGDETAPHDICIRIGPADSPKPLSL